MIQTFIGKKTILFVKEKKQKISSSLVERRRGGRRRERERPNRRSPLLLTPPTKAHTSIYIYFYNEPTISFELNNNVLYSS